ncbi:MAG TPA: efflux RND transporter permease subunit, partial [bacterium]|nr:efflux RND transporter permease subunit [bacterium]
ALFILSGYKIAHKDIDHPSTFQENEFAAVIFPLAGARLESNSETVKKVEDIIRKIPDVEMFNSTIRKDDARIFIRLKPKSKRTYSKEEIMKLLDEKGNEGVKQVHDDYSMILDEGEGGGGDQRKLIVNIFGNDGDTLEKLANEFAKRMGQVPGLSNIVMTDLRKRAEYALVVDKGRAAMYGLSVKSVADSVHSLVRGMRPTKFHELTKGQEIEVITRLQAVYRQKIDDLRYLYLQTPNGNQVTLGEIASFQPTTGPQTIDRKDKYRYVFVKADTKGTIETVAKQVKELVKDVKLPDEYYWRFGGIYEDLIKGKSQLSAALLLTMFLVYMVMACLFESYLQPLLVMISVPMASIGIWAALAITKKPLSENVFVGMILLAGYVVNAAIIMVDHTNHLRAQGAPHVESLIQAGMDRLRPITMTTLSTSLGFLPMALSWGSSSDLWAPLAVTVIGGLLSSTCLTLFVLPNFILIAEDITAGIRWIFGLVFHFVGLLKNRFLKFISN